MLGRIREGSTQGPLTSCLRKSLLLLAVAGVGCGSRTYEDCVLERVTEGMEPYSVAVVEQACREKFPERTAQGTDLLDFEVSALQGRAGPKTASGIFSGSLYNGNEAIAVTEVQVAVTTTTDGEKSTYLYRVTVDIPPQAASDFSFKLLPGEPEASYSWTILRAKGIVINANTRQRTINTQRRWERFIEENEQEAGGNAQP